ncbi:MAG: hypothetical protein ACOYON_14770 [Fimbriimonas sp.]
MKRVGIALAILVGLLAIGCGQSEDRTDVRNKMSQAQASEPSGAKPEGTPENP